MALLPRLANQAMADRAKQDGRSTASAVLQLYPGEELVRHFALLRVLVLVVLHDRRDGFQAVFVAVLHRVLEIEILDWDVIGPKPKVSAHRFEVGLLRRSEERRVGIGCRPRT